jgi:hypothetical protein
LHALHVGVFIVESLLAKGDALANDAAHQVDILCGVELSEIYANELIDSFHSWLWFKV